MLTNGIRILVAVGIWTMGSLLYAQQTTPVNFFAHVGSLEIDYNRDGREDALDHYAEGGVSLDQVRYALDYDRKYGGYASQRISLTRDSGAPGRYVASARVNKSECQRALTCAAGPRREIHRVHQQTAACDNQHRDTQLRNHPHQRRKERQNHKRNRAVILTLQKEIDNHQVRQPQRQNREWGRPAFLGEPV